MILNRIDKLNIEMEKKISIHSIEPISDNFPPENLPEIKAKLSRYIKNRKGIHNVRIENL